MLDVQLGEDFARQQDRRGAANLAALRRFVVSVLRQEKTLNAVQSANAWPAQSTQTIY